MKELFKVKGVTIGSGRPKICAPLTGTTREALLREAILAREAGADLVEWRIDYYQEVFDEAKVKETLVLIHEMLEGLPLLLTFRTLSEGGSRDISMIDTELVDLIDMELFKIESLEKGLLEEIHQRKIPLVISNHDFKETPADPVLLYRLNMMEHFGASIGKIAVMPNNERDVLRLMELTRRAHAFVSIPLVTMSMGELGMVSRLAGNVTGSAITFGALDVDHTSAPGQLPVRELRNILNLLHENEI